MVTTDLEKLTPLPGPLEATDLVHVRRVRTGKDHRATPDQSPGGEVNRGANSAPTRLKGVRVLDDDDPRWDEDNDEPTLASINPLFCHIGEEIPVEFYGKYVLVFDGDPARPGGLSGGQQTWRDGRMKRRAPWSPANGCRPIPPKRWP